MERDVARKLAEVEYRRLIETLERLEPREWERHTDCSGWDVRAMAGHLLGMMELAASPEENQRQQKAAFETAEREGAYRIDALTALQVTEHADLAPSEVVARMHATVPGAIAGRFGIPDEARQAPYATGAPLNETWTVGYLLEVILTRDPWMHRVDICAATGRPMVLTPDHDAVIVADVVEEWARRHGQPFSLELTGVPGGNFESGEAGDVLSLDAVEFCRILSGRPAASEMAAKGLLGQAVPF
jgi:uncharacterized protein (TIGR03083 family)